MSNSTVGFDPSELPLILDILAAGRQADYSNIAALCLLVYIYLILLDFLRLTDNLRFDYILTIRQEVDLVWTVGRWGITTISFILFRYLAMFALVFNSYVYVNTTATLNFCAPAIRFQVATYSSIVGLTEAFLALRVWIMYEKMRYIGWFLVFVLVGNWATIAGFNVKVFGGKLTGSPFPPPLSTGCDTIGIPIPDLLFLQVIPRAITAFILFALTAMKTFWAVKQSRKHTPTLTLVLRDGVMYFAMYDLVIRCDSLLTDVLPAGIQQRLIEFINGMFFRFARLSLKGAVSGFEVIIQYMITCRMFFNIRSLLLFPDDGESENDTYGIGRSKSIQFASNPHAEIETDFTNTDSYGSGIMSRDWTRSRDVGGIATMRSITEAPPTAILLKPLGSTTPDVDADAKSEEPLGNAL